jgi:putative phosphoribosyl transferase
MYFRNRADAGRKLAKELTKYQRKNSVVLALNPGGVMVGAQIAMKLHTDLFMLLAERVHVPGEPVAIGSVSSDNSFVYNPAYSTGEIEELAMEYHGLIESERMAKIHKLHMVMGSAGEVPRDLLKRRVVILVSDGLHDGFDLSVAAHFLKPVNIHRLVLAVPIASVPAVDAMHLFGDEIHCLYVAEFLFETDHYYDDNIVPDADGLHKIMRNTPLNWHFSNV